MKELHVKEFMGAEKVLNHEKGTWFKSLHPWNKPSILLTFDVSIFVKLIDANFTQLENIYPMFSTEDVLKCDKSIDSNLEHELNIPCISLTLDVSKLKIILVVV